MFKVIDDETRKRVLDELLKGERGIEATAAAEGVSGQALRSWLKKHYDEHPDDPRRHLVERTSERYPRDVASEEPATDAPPTAEIEDEGETEDVGADDDTEARDDMGQKNRSAGNRGRHPKRAQGMALLATGEHSQADIARTLGVSEGTISYWAKQRLLEPIQKAENKKYRAAVIADFKAGYVGDALAKRHKKHVGRTAVYRWIAEYRQEQEEFAERKKENLAKAREAKKEMLKDPAYRAQMRTKNWRNREAAASNPNGQLDLPVPNETTTLSRPEPSERAFQSTRAPESQPVAQSRSLVVVRHEAEFPPDSQMANEMLRECIEERQTLRGMVTLLQREQEELKKQLTVYKRTFGEMRK